jgi:starch phosphorylase
MALARDVAEWRQRVEHTWPQVVIRSVKTRSPAELRVGELLAARAWVELGSLTADDVSVELYVGRLDAHGDFSEACGSAMQLIGTDNECSVFEARVPPGDGSGLHGYTVRVLPKHADLASPFQPGLIAWAPPAAAASA